LWLSHQARSDPMQGDPGGRDSRVMTPDQFLKEYRRALETLQTAYREIRVEGLETTEIERTPRGQPEKKPAIMKGIKKFSYFMSDGNEKLLYEKEQPKFWHRVFISANGHQFKMGRQTPDAPYFLERTAGADGFYDFRHFRSRIRDAPY